MNNELHVVETLNDKNENENHERDMMKTRTEQEILIQSKRQSLSVK